MVARAFTLVAASLCLALTPVAHSAPTAGLPIVNLTYACLIRRHPQQARLITVTRNNTKPLYITLYTNPNEVTILRADQRNNIGDRQFPTSPIFATPSRQWATCDSEHQFRSEAKAPLSTMGPKGWCARQRLRLGQQLPNNSFQRI